LIIHGFSSKGVARNLFLLFSLQPIKRMKNTSLLFMQLFLSS